MSEQPEQVESENGTEPQDVKSRFREALERKQAKAKSGEGHATAGSKVGDAHGPASAKRTFRRKSG